MSSTQVLGPLEDPGYPTPLGFKFERSKLGKKWGNSCVRVCSPVPTSPLPRLVIGRSISNANSSSTQSTPAAQQGCCSWQSIISRRTNKAGQTSTVGHQCESSSIARITTSAIKLPVRACLSLF